MPFSESPPPPTPPHLRPSVVVPFSSVPGERSESDKFPSALYEFVYHAIDRIPGTTVARHAGDGGVFMLIVLPHPVDGFDLTTGTTTRVLAGILHEETLTSESGPALVTVGGWLVDSIDEAQANWDDFILQGDDLPDPSEHTEPDDE